MDTDWLLNILKVKDKFMVMLDGVANVWTLDTSFEEFQQVCPSDPEVVLHYSIEGSQYFDQPMSVVPEEWKKLKELVRKCGVSKHVVIESSNADTWDSPDTRKGKERARILEAQNVTPPKRSEHIKRPTAKAKRKMVT